MKYKYTVLFTDGSISYVYAENVSEAYEIALDIFDKNVMDIWCD